ncbi:Plug domain-containing protein [Longimicrobium sp.]|uniref:Plug domain-containing protein n=1 Tax=Longimicrobium sp. TaxID=2029185 RepID=UPI002C3C2F13|nr:Plug domain-containing protein [Longimicrobium sp.]HSU16613.1 Plug domain-containing protein [Longimicrobium sp.]
MRRVLRPALFAAALAPGLGAAPAHAHAQVRDTVPQRPSTRPPAPAPAPAPAPPVPPPAARDTIPGQRRDSVQVAIPGEAVRGDTIPGAKTDTTTVPDSTVAAPSFPAHPLPPAHGFSDATYVFGPEQLQYFHGLSLADLLDRIPGLVITRTGGFGRPMGVSPFASGGGRFRIFLDGYELRPLTGATPDLQRIPIVNLQSVRVQRGLEEIRVDITSLRLADIRPFAQIEGMDGDLGTRALRALFTRPIGRHMVAEVGLDLDQSSGSLRRQPFSETHTVERLSYAFTPDWGLQAELRTTKLNSESRLTSSVELESLDRSELILRGRGRILGANLEAMAGRSLQRPAGADTLSERVRSVQADFRATVPLSFGMLAAGARLHRGEEDGWAPNQTEVWGRLDFDPAPWLAATGEVRQLTIGGVTGLEATGSLRAGPWGGFSLFGQLATGNRGVRYLAGDSVVLKTIGGIGGTGVPALDTVQVQVIRTLDSSVDGLRAGAEFNRGLFHLGAAVVTHNLDQAAPYGFAFDRAAPVQPGLNVTGVEAYGSIPLYFRQLTLNGWYQRWLNTPDRPYLPSQLGRASVQFNGVYKQGNLEPTLRFEVVGRDEAIAYNPATLQNEPVARYALFNWFVQIRIIDIRIFWRYENAFNRRGPYDVANTQIPGGRALYGVRWFFRN